MFVPYLEVSLHPARDENTHIVPTLLFFPLFFFAVLLFRREGGTIVIDSIWRRYLLYISERNHNV